MANTDDRQSGSSTEANLPPPQAGATEAKAGAPAAPLEHAVHPGQHEAALTSPPPATPPKQSENSPPAHPWRKWVLLGSVVAIAAYGVYAVLIPWAVLTFNTVSTDDAYVNGHVTFVAPRVAGQVSHVLVDDNYRVKKGDVLVRLDREPYLVQLEIKKAAVVAAEADLVAANAQVRALLGQARASRFKLEHAIEDVNTQIANLRANVEKLNSARATLALAKGNLQRGEKLAPAGISKEELDSRRQTVKVAEAMAEQALQQVYAVRVGLGLPAQPPKGQNLTDVPPDLDQNFSTVREALGMLMQTAAQFGYFPTSWNATPKQVVEAFYKQDPKGNLDHIYAKLIPEAPAIKQAEAKLLQARSDLDQAKLNLRYCDVVSEIDGVVTRRNVNPGNNVAVGQSLMAVRSLTEIWIDANFKETQLADLRIGQRVKVEVDMYGGRQEFEGRITGFTMGTGQTLALLPPQNATGNFVKIVQRLPVRIELTDYDPDRIPLFVGLSCTPYVYIYEPPTGPNAGEFLQPFTPLPRRPPEPKP
jgi:membrane fusion protein (multidrug efflux system)